MNITLVILHITSKFAWRLHIHTCLLFPLVIVQKTTTTVYFYRLLSLLFLPLYTLVVVGHFIFALATNFCLANVFLLQMPNPRNPYVRKARNLFS